MNRPHHQTQRIDGTVNRSDKLQIKTMFGVYTTEYTPNNGR